LKKIYSIFVLFTLGLFLTAPKIDAQECCGMEYCVGFVLYSGVNGGYGVQQYSATGFNDYIKYYNKKRTSTLTKQMDEFGFAKGFTIGGKFFQYEADRILFSMKFIYNAMDELHYATASTGKREYELKLTTLGLGFNVSKVISKSFDFKIADVFLTFNSAKLFNRFISNTNSSQNTEQELKSPESSIGGIYSAGVVFYPLPPFLSFEINVGYSYFTINEMEFSNGSSLAKNEDSNLAMDNFISGGGFFANATIQIAIPFGDF
jgi:hypothetical protein